MTRNIADKGSSPGFGTPRTTRTGSTGAGSTRASCWVAIQRWMLWLGFAFFTMSGWVRMVNAITNWYWLDFAQIRPGPLYLAVTGGLWGLAGLVALVWIVLRRPGFPLVGCGAALLFALTYWVDRLFISTHPDGTGNTPFAILLTLILLAYVILVLRPLPDLRSLLK